MVLIDQSKGCPDQIWVPKFGLPGCVWEDTLTDDDLAPHMLKTR